MDKCRSEVRKLQKKTQKGSNEKYMEREQKVSEELGQLQRALLAFRSYGLRQVTLLHFCTLKYSYHKKYRENLQNYLTHLLISCKFTQIFLLSEILALSKV